MSETGLPEVDAAAVTGNIVVAGSSTVFPLTQAMAERFTDEGYTGNITIDSIGTGGGFERFCVAGETDIANASRPINEEETASCQAIGRTPIEFRVGTDALAVVVSNENTFLTGLSLEQLAAIYNGDVKTWSEVDPSYPAEAIQLFSPGSDSGTYDYFVEEVLGEDDTKLQASGAQFSENDNVLVQGVEGSPYAIAYFGYAYYNAEADRLKALEVEGVMPTAETAENGDYPLARPLFIYSDATVMSEKPQVASFINFYLSFVNEEIIDVGYFPASDDALQQAKQSWLAPRTSAARIWPDSCLASRIEQWIRMSARVAADVMGAPCWLLSTRGDHGQRCSRRRCRRAPAPLDRAAVQGASAKTSSRRLLLFAGSSRLHDDRHRVRAAARGADILRAARGDDRRIFRRNTTWAPQIGEFGILPLLNATLCTTLLAMLVAGPLGLGAAIYLSEYATPRARAVLKPLLEILAGVPTVVYGYFALTFVTPICSSRCSARSGCRFITCSRPA